MDSNELLGRVWAIAWQHMILWIFNLPVLIGGFLFLPLILPFAALPFAVMQTESSRTIVIIAASFLILYLPCYAVSLGGVQTFIKAGWLVGYLRLTRTSAGSPAAATA